MSTLHVVNDHQLHRKGTTKNLITETFFGLSTDKEAKRFQVAFFFLIKAQHASKNS